SNIGRLFLAHHSEAQDDPEAFTHYRKVYFSGLGASFDTSLGAQAAGTMARADTEANKVPGSVAGGQAVQAARDSWSGRSWWQRLQRDLGTLRDKPYHAFKVLKNTLINSTAEALAPIRDSRWAAHHMKTGVDTRLQGALERIQRELNALNTSDPAVRTIKLSVFGFDFGATLARAFVHELLQRSEQRGQHYYYRDARLELMFAGLFDAVDRTSAEVPPLEFFLPTSNRVDDGGLISPEVKAVLHLVAAHERRFYRRARLLGDSHPEWREELLPGVSENIGGGMAPGEQKPSNELALVSLHRMYRAAFAAGSSLPAMADLPARGRVISALFTYNDRTPSQRNAHGLARHYQRFVGREAPSADAFTLHMRCYIRWLAHLWAGYQGELAALRAEERRLYEGELPALRSGIFGVVSESATQRQERQQREQQRDLVREQRAALQADMAWLEQVNKEAESIRRRLTHLGDAAAGNAAQKRVWEILLHEWEHPQPLPDEVAELFGFFVHDQQVLSTTQRSMKSLTGEHFFIIRGFDRPRGELPAQAAS
ncbi:MAG: hypothetical protein EA348_00765, partial [Pseudomonadaceae bacterium]